MTHGTCSFVQGELYRKLLVKYWAFIAALKADFLCYSLFVHYWAHEQQVSPVL